MPKERVIVVGGGVIGCSIAYHLAGAGAAVTLVERGKVGSGASDVAAGMVAALSENLALGEPLNLALLSRAMLLDILPSLQSESGIDVEYRSPGILQRSVRDGSANGSRTTSTGPSVEAATGELLFRSGNRTRPVRITSR